MKKYYINLTEQEHSQIIHSLIDKKNALMAQHIDFLSDVCYVLFVTNDLNERGRLGGELYRRAMEREKGCAYGKVL